MLRLYCGREIIDKERFIYDRIHAAGGETLVLVPNQYTLVAEERALNLLGCSCLYDVEILSMNRLGLRVLTEQGIESMNVLDKYGRFMLLGKIIREHRDELKVFGNSVDKISFTNLLDDFIMEFKQQSCTIDEIRGLLGADETDELLKTKLSELEDIVEAYENALAGHYTDSEDYIAAYVAAIRDSRYVKGKNIWIYGYDSITPKFMNATFELAAVANVNFVVNLSDFELGDRLVRMLTAEGRARGTEVVLEPVGHEYALEKTETVARIERGLWNDNLSKKEREDNRDFAPCDLQLVCCGNPHYEAENAAAYVYHLVRDLGYKFRDIQMIVNDEGVMQPIVRRTFEEYGLPVFTDQPRKITDSPSVSFIANQLSFARYGEGSEFLFAVLKSGMTDISYDDIELLENYAGIYRIRGTMWKRPFRYGEEAYGAEQFAKLEAMRARIVGPLMKIEELAEGKTVGEFVRAYKRYLEDEWQLSQHVSELANAQESLGLHEEAMKGVQSYEQALALLDQMSEIIGDEELKLSEFLDIYLQGIGKVEVGIIPPTADGIAMGTMIRTRPRPVKAVLILGATEGTTPLQPSTEGLFSPDEKAYFRDRNFALGSLDDLKMEEENVAMYRVLSKPSDKLYISWSMTDTDGNDTAASPIIDSLKELFPRIEEDGLIKKDLVSMGWNDGERLINSPWQAMRHLINHIKNRNTPREMDMLTEALFAWFENNNPQLLEKMLALAKEENIIEPLGEKTAAELFARKDGSLVLSASAINSYYECPFRYYVERGLRLEEERKFESDPRSIGDVYHDCMMRVASVIISDREYGKRLADESTDELERLVSAELDKIADSYDGGLFVSSGNEQFHLDRIKEICSQAALAMARQLTAESVEWAGFEENFGRGCRFKPIEMTVDGRKVYVEGKIDRADVLSVVSEANRTGDADGSISEENADSGAPEQQEQRMRIVDYKTGADKLDVHKMSHGYKMQLMIYMISAIDGGYEPAGIFYFNIKDQIESFNDRKEARGLNNEVSDDGPEDAFKLSGSYIDEPGVLSAMPKSVLKADSKMSREEFDELQRSVRKNIESIAGDIGKGKIEVRPFINNKKLVCGYCRYKAICRRDREYYRNAGREIPPEEKKKKSKSKKKT